MHLRHFFRGLLKREEVASAFLATLLECEPAFREAFFQELFPDAAADLAGARWTVQVEMGRVDVRMESEKAIVLIENKIRAGAYESGQLVRYYKSELPTDKTIFVAFVAPEGVGVHETDELTTLESFRERDSAALVSWQRLATVAHLLQIPKSGNWFVESGFEEIARIIDEDSRPTYPREGTRAVLARIADDALRALGSLSTIQFSRWSGRDHEQILTNKTNITLWLSLVFDAEEEPPYRPINVEDGDRLRVSLRTQFKLSGAGRKKPGLKAWWSQAVAERTFEIPKVGEHHLDDQGWFVRSAEIVLPPDKLADAMTQAGLAVVEELSERLGELGFSLGILE
jgi:hypothetical protein